MPLTPVEEVVMSIVNVLLVLANVLGVGMIVPQVVRLRRVRSLAGVSVPWIGISLVLNAWWVGYGLAEERWGVVPVSVGGALLYVWMACLAVDLGGATVVRGLVIGALAASLAPGAGLVMGGWTAAGLIIGLSYGVQFAPAAWSAVRSERLDGVSPSTWAMAWGEAAIWFVYGLDVGDLALLVGGGGGAAMASVILVRLGGRRRRFRWSPVGRAQGVAQLAT